MGNQRWAGPVWELGAGPVTLGWQQIRGNDPNKPTPKTSFEPLKKERFTKNGCFVTFWFRGCGKEGNGYSWLSSERNPKGKELAAKSSTHHMSVTPHRRKQTLKG